MAARDDEFLRCYLDELSYLRRMGARFAQEHPKIARRLELQADECPDPHVERLIESFAFLTARIQSDLENDFPEIATELLQILYPHYLNAIPSMTIVRFDPEPAVTEAIIVPRETPLFVSTVEGDLCRFRTCYETKVWPVAVTDAKFVESSEYEFPSRRRRPASVLRLTIESLGEPFETLGLDTLRFYLHGDTVVNRLYTLLLEGERHRLTVVPQGEQSIPDLPYLEVRQVGFAADEDVIPYPREGHPAYRLLQEYFAFEEKFHFFDVTGLQGRAFGTKMDLLFLLDEEPGRLFVTPDAFVLGCSPAINLFTRTSEPIRVDQRRTEYRLVADHRRLNAVQTHSIRSVSGSSDAANRSRQYAPYYSYTHAMARENQSAFWHSRRGQGNEIFISFHDAAFDPSLPPDEVVYAHLLCTNGTLAAEIPAGKHLETDLALPVTQIVNLRKPTQLAIPPHDGQSLWRLVSHLSLNFLTLEGEKATAALREILFLYCSTDSRSQRQKIDGIRSVTSEKVVRRLPDNSWNGFARGTKVTVTLEDFLFTSRSAYLFASVLSHFLGLHASINSFTQLQIRREGDEKDTALGMLKGRQWPLMVGGKAVL